MTAKESRSLTISEKYPYGFGGRWIVFWILLLWNGCSVFFSGKVGVYTAWFLRLQDIAGTPAVLRMQCAYALMRCIVIVFLMLFLARTDRRAVIPAKSYAFPMFVGGAYGMTHFLRRTDNSFLPASILEVLLGALAPAAIFSYIQRSRSVRSTFSSAIRFCRNMSIVRFVSVRGRSNGPNGKRNNSLVRIAG